MHRQGKQSIQVTIRIRPLFQREPQLSQSLQSNRLCVSEENCNTPGSQRLMLSNGTDAKSFAFDQIIASSQQQDAVFERVGRDSITRCLEGYNCSIFAYGQTGAGKTFTMMGVGHESPQYYERRGLIPRTLEYLFGCVEREAQEKEKEKTEYLIVCKFLEIYNETIIDLLDKNNKNLQLREDLKKGVYVEGLSEVTVSRSEEALELLRKGSKGRHVGSTFYNDNSSRSHSVFTLEIQSRSTRNSVTNVKQRSFHFIDLAGSERTKLLPEERVKEGCSINKSLHVLGMVINSLVESTEGKPKHIGYRDSKLTFLLKDSLGGNSKTHLIANISPSMASYNQTLSTLSFAKRVKLIKVDKPLINEDTTGSLETLKLEIVRLKQQLMEVRTSNVGSHLVSMQSLEGDASEIVELALKNEGQIELEKLFKEYVDEAIEKETKMQVQVLRCSERLRILEESSSKGETPNRISNIIHPTPLQNQRSLSQTLKYNIDFLKKLSKLLSTTITDRENISQILQAHHISTFIPHNQPTPQPDPTNHLEKYEQLCLQSQLLKQTISENELIIELYEENQRGQKQRMEEIIMDHTRVLEEIRERCGGELGRMERREEEMEGNINRMALEIMELRQELVMKGEEIREQKARTKGLSQQIVGLNMRVQASSTAEKQATSKYNEIKKLLKCKQDQIQNLTKQLQQAASIVNSVQIQFQQQKKNNSERYTEIIRINEETIWQLEKQISKHRLQKVTCEKQRQLDMKRAQEFYDESAKLEEIIVELKQELVAMGRKLEVERNNSKAQLNWTKSQQEKEIEARYEELLSEKRVVLASLESENEALKVEKMNLSTDLKLKANVEAILNSRLESQVARNRQIEEEFYLLKEKLLESEEVETRHKREIQSLRRKDTMVTEQINTLLKEKSALEQSCKAFEICSSSLKEELAEMRQKLLRKESQLERVKSSYCKEQDDIKDEFEEFRRRSHQNQEYFKQLFEESNNGKEKILAENKKHLLEAQKQLVQERLCLEAKNIEIKAMNRRIQALQGHLKEKDQLHMDKDSEIDELKQELQARQLRYITSIEEREASFNHFNERKAQQIEELEEKVEELMWVIKEQDQQKMTLLQQEFDIMKHNHNQLLRDYSIDIKEKQAEIVDKEEMIARLNEQMQERSQRIKQLEQYEPDRAQQSLFGSASVRTFAELSQQHSIFLSTIQDLNCKLQQRERIINTLQIDNDTLTTNINYLTQELQQTNKQSEILMREKQLISSDLNEKLEQIEDMKRRWESIRRQELETIEGQFSEYRDQTQRMNSKLMRSCEMLKEEQERYRELVERHEEVVEWNRRLLEESGGIMGEEEEQNIKNKEMWSTNAEEKENLMANGINTQCLPKTSSPKLGGQTQSQCVLLDVILEQDSRQINRTEDITNPQIQQQNLDTSNDLVNMTSERSEVLVQENGYVERQSYENLMRQFRSLQQAYENLEEQYFQSSQHWQTQKEQFINTITALQDQHQQQHHSRKDKPNSLKKPRPSLHYQQDLSLRYELQKRSCQINELSAGFTQIIQLLNIKGLSQSGSRFKIEAIKSSIQTLIQQLGSYKKQVRQKEKEIEMRNVRAEMKEREFGRRMGGVEGKGKKCVREVDEMVHQKSILLELRRRMKGQENRNVNGNLGRY